MKRTRILASVMTAALLALTASGAVAQRRGGGRFGSYRLPPNPHYDGAFMFCRIAFDNAMNGDGAGWSVDYPRADENLSYRFSELTSAPVSRDIAGNFNHADRKSVV